MARKSNGHASKEVQYQAPLTAIQELIGAIGTMGANVQRFDLGEYDMFLFAVRREHVHSGEPHTSIRRAIRRSSTLEQTRPLDTPRPSLEAIIDAACRRLGVSRRELESGSQSRSVSLARFLIARHATASGVASFAEVASKMDRKENSLKVGIARYKKRIPDEFTMSMERFLDTTKTPSKKLQALLGQKWSAANAEPSMSDSEIGERLARELPQETK
jgi:hypothetical protein